MSEAARLIALLWAGAVLACSGVQPAGVPDLGPAGGGVDQPGLVDQGGDLSGPVDPGADVVADPGPEEQDVGSEACEGENPEGCMSSGCPAGHRCSVEHGCAPRACVCVAELAEWTCTRDCEGGVCVPEGADVPLPSDLDDSGVDPGGEIPSLPDPGIDPGLDPGTTADEGDDGSALDAVDVEEPLDDGADIADEGDAEIPDPGGADTDPDVSDGGEVDEASQDEDASDLDQGAVDDPGDGGEQISDAEEGAEADGSDLADDSVRDSCGDCTEPSFCDTPTGQCQPHCPPDCSGRDCGDDGCGGLCGLCLGGEICAAGECIAACVDEDGDGYGEGCLAGEDCDDTRPGVHPGAQEACSNGLDDDCRAGDAPCCVGRAAKRCYAGVAYWVDTCGRRGDIALDCWLPELGEGLGCIECGDSVGCLRKGGADCLGRDRIVKPPNECSTAPDPAERTVNYERKIVQRCGTLGCNPMQKACRCRADCTGRVCGSDGCGDICGECAAGFQCTPEGSCVCAEDCSERICGSDGCGGSCGTCPTGSVCAEDATRCPCRPGCVIDPEPDARGCLCPGAPCGNLRPGRGRCVGGKWVFCAGAGGLAVVDCQSSFGGGCEEAAGACTCTDTSSFCASVSGSGGEQASILLTCADGRAKATTCSEIISGAFCGTCLHGDSYERACWCEGGEPLSADQGLCLSGPAPGCPDGRLRKGN